MTTSEYTKNTAETVLLTGASGFIATHIVNQLFEQGYNIIGTVRSEEKGNWLARRFPGFKYEIVDLSTSAAENKSSFIKIFKAHPEIKYVIHAASPVFYYQENFYRNIFVPAVEGTKAILQAAHEHGPNIKKFIYTSSLAAAADIRALSESPFLTEESWNSISDDPEELDESWQNAYSASKTYAERAIWKFKETAKPQFSISTFVFPVVYGPPIHDVTYETLGLSIANAKQLMELPKDAKEIPVVARISIDVRDVARGHVRSLSNPEFDNKRSAMIANVADGQLIADIIHKNRPTEAANLAIGTPGVYNTTPETEYDFSKTNARLGFKFIPLQKTVLDQFDAIWQLKKESEKKEQK
jgi:NADPH-dependent methylglyoxal reductase